MATIPIITGIAKSFTSSSWNLSPIVTADSPPASPTSTSTESSSSESPSFWLSLGSPKSPSSATKAPRSAFTMQENSCGSTRFIAPSPITIQVNDSPMSPISSTLSLRALRSNDIKKLRLFHHEHLPHTPALPAWFYFHHLQSPSCLALVLVDQSNAIVGEICANLLSPEDPHTTDVYLSTLSIDERFQRLGLGTKLIHSLLASIDIPPVISRPSFLGLGATPRQSIRITAHVPQSAHSAEAFYEKLGLTTTSVVNGYYSSKGSSLGAVSGDAAWLMSGSF